MDTEMISSAKVNSPNSPPNSRVPVHLYPQRALTALEIQTFTQSIHMQLEMLTHIELLNLIQIGHIAVNLNAVYENKFGQDDVLIVFADFGDDLNKLLSAWNLSWIVGFKYFHCHVFADVEDEESPLANPRWDDIVSMSRGELILSIEDFMNPMSIDMFETSFAEFQEKKELALIEQV
jgi:hypothetical protein